MVLSKTIYSAIYTRPIWVGFSLPMRRNGVIFGIHCKPNYSKERIAFFDQFSSIITFSSATDGNYDTKDGKLYLHIGPSGDCWTGSSIFAAKHLQPDYVKSIELPTEIAKDDDKISVLIELVDEDPKLQKDIYDNGTIPELLLEQVR